MFLAYLIIFGLFAELSLPIYSDDFQDVEVKKEHFEQDTVSCEHMQQNFIWNRSLVFNNWLS